jgi:hypothetical protein
LISPAALLVLKRLSEFQYQFQNFEDAEAVYLGPYALENGAVYDGQWKFGLRFGKGK